MHFHRRAYTANTKPINSAAAVIPSRTNTNYIELLTVTLYTRTMDQ